MNRWAYVVSHCRRRCLDASKEFAALNHMDSWTCTVKCEEPSSKGPNGVLYDIHNQLRQCFTDHSGADQEAVL